MSMKQTPSQTVGPFFAYGLTAEQYGYDFTQLATGQMRPDDNMPGEPIRIVGRVFDGDGEIVPDAMIELWQANSEGRYRHPADDRSERPLTEGFTGFGRMGTGTDPQQRFVFETVKPGAAGDGSAPFISVIVFMRGLPNHAYTRIYFSDEAEANASDPVLSRVAGERRDTLIAQRHESPAGVEYRFDIHMQGDRETVFFDL